MNSNKKYNLSYSAGALLSGYFDIIVINSKDLSLLIKGEEKIDLNIIPANAESSRKRYASEIMSRLKNFPLDILEYYIYANESDKKVIQFYSICRRYQIIVEFMIEIVRNKWLNLDYELDKHEYKSFLLTKLAETDDQDQVTENTIYKLTQVFFKMISELGMYSENAFQKIEVSHSLLQLIDNTGDRWFFDVLLLSDEEKNEIHS